MGYGLYDARTDAGMKCHVLAPALLAKSPRHKKDKADEIDALRLLEVLRGHLLAGNAMPAVWIPDKQLRDDRELVRLRQDTTRESSRLKTQIKMLLKRNVVRKPSGTGGSWSAGYRAWLRGLAEAPQSPLGVGGREALSAFLRRLEFYEKEISSLDESLLRLAKTDRYHDQAVALDNMMGVGILTAMIFLTEVGDARRFSNRRQIAAYFGLAPARYESGKKNDCKGHITRQGSGRVRAVLSQAAWARVRRETTDQARYERLVARNPRHKKIAVVACMRRLLIKMWRCSLDCVQDAGRQPPSRPPEGEATAGVTNMSARKDARRKKINNTGVPVTETPACRMTAGVAVRLSGG
jgi:transposase